MNLFSAFLYFLALVCFSLFSYPHPIIIFCFILGFSIHKETIGDPTQDSAVQSVIDKIITVVKQKRILPKPYFHVCIPFLLLYIYPPLIMDTFECRIATAITVEQLHNRNSTLVLGCSISLYFCVYSFVYIPLCLCFVYSLS